MSLTFPNPSRSYDSKLKTVRFTGHDGMFQIAFSVELDVLTKKRVADDQAEALALAAFDDARSDVMAMATKAYNHHKKSSYTLTSSDY